MKYYITCGISHAFHRRSPLLQGCGYMGVVNSKMNQVDQAGLGPSKDYFRFFSKHNIRCLRNRIVTSTDFK
jgi:hypothetical protein